MSIDKMVRESVNLGLEFNGAKALIDEVDFILKIKEKVFLDKTLSDIAKNSEPPLPAKLYENFPSGEGVQVGNLLKDIFLESVSHIERINESFDKIKRLIEVVYGVSYQSQMYQEPYVRLVELNNHFNLFQEMFICHFSKLLKNPPPKAFLQNRIAS